MAGDASDAKKYMEQLGAFLILVVVQSTAILLFKVCQEGGKYTFNPASSVALTEVCKLVLAGGLHSQYVHASKKPFFDGVSVCAPSCCVLGSLPWLWHNGSNGDPAW